MSRDVVTGLPTVLTQQNFDPTVYAVPTSGVTAHWGSAIDQVSLQTGVPAQIIHAVMRQESGGNANAHSPAGAIGLMQLMPDTARGLGVNPHDPSQNLLGGAKYLKQLHDHFGDWTQTLAAYNAGPATQWPGPFAQSRDNPHMRVWQSPSNSGFAQTRDYVTRITNDINSRPGRR